MKITIIGASAGVGFMCVERALARGHKVTTLSRNVDNLPQNPNLTAIKGSATHLPDLKKAFVGADAVIIALGTGKSMKATTLYTDFAKVLIELQKEINTQIPLIILTGFGAGNSSEYQGFFMKIFFRLFLKDIYINKTEMEEMIAASSIKWEFVRPGVLNDKPLSEKYRVETNYYKGMNIGSISRSDVADFLVKQAEKPTEIGKYPALSNT
jgi:putative NADH-flavin reductase